MSAHRQLGAADSLSAPAGPAAADPFSLAGRVAVVTGAARGIGRAAAMAFAKRGADVVLFDLLGERLHATAQELRSLGGKVEPVVGDVTAASDIDELVTTTEAMGAVDIIVNSAGIIKRTDVRELIVDDLDELWAVNVRGLVAVTQAFLPTMIERRSGSIINLGSLGSVTGLEMRTAYASTKGAVAQYTVSLASEVGKFGVRVNAIAPGYVDTDMAGTWINGVPERSQQLLDRIPLHRFARAEDMEGAFVFLASGASAYVTGQVIMVDGGWTTT